MLKLKYPLILASNSPRRQELLSIMGFEYTVKASQIEETYPQNLPISEVAVYLAEKKIRSIVREYQESIILSADTIVCIDNTILGKPESLIDAKTMLLKLSGSMHKVYTGVCIYTENQFYKFTDCTEVTFRKLGESEIDYYINKYIPLDKAGAYGIQEWIGLSGIEKINGSYFNVVGLPSEKVFSKLNDLKLIEIQN